VSAEGRAAVMPLCADGGGFPPPLPGLTRRNIKQLVNGRTVYQ